MKDEPLGTNLMNAFGNPLARMVMGEGCYLWDETGKRYLDFLGGIATNSLGHCHPVVRQALAEQAATLDHVSNFFVTPAQEELSRLLCTLAGTGEGGRVFLTNSGTEANEAAIKLARLWGNPRGKSRILAFEGAFHGRSVGALSLTAKPQYREPFAPLLPGVDHVGLSVAALEEAMGDDVAAVFLEPLQGEAGVRELPEGLLEAARELTTRHGALLILDEVQTGAGRTGAWFAFQHSSVVPDAVTVAKGMGGGFPVGALVAFPQVADLFYPGSHGTTFGGNPLASHVSCRVLKTIDLDNVRAQGQRIRQAVAALGSPLVDHVRGEGLLLGIVLTEPRAPEVAAAALRAGLIINAPAPDVLRIVPPLTVTAAEVDEFADLLGACLSSL